MLRNKKDLITFYHTTCFSPSKATWLQAINKGYFIGWPNLSPNSVNKHLRIPEATIKGHPQLRVLYMNTSEIIPSLARNIGDIGISGKDLWKESEPNIQ